MSYLLPTCCFSISGFLPGETVLLIRVIVPEYVLPHSDHIWQVLDVSMIHQSLVESSSDESGYLRSHSAFDVELGYWEWRFAVLADCKSFELAAI